MQNDNDWYNKLMIINIAYATSSITSPSGVIDAITRASGILYSVLLVLAVLFILVGAFQILTAGDNAEKFKKGKQQIIYAAVAVAIGILATGIVKLVQQLLGQ